MKQFAEKGHERNELKGVGIATQRETTLLWDRVTGNPLHNASTSPSSSFPALAFLSTVCINLIPSTVAWPDARNAGNVRSLRAKAETRTFHTPDGDIVGEEGVRRLTGLPFSCVFLASYSFLIPRLTLLPSQHLLLGDQVVVAVREHPRSQGGGGEGNAHDGNRRLVARLRELISTLFPISFKPELTSLFLCSNSLAPKTAVFTSPTRRTLAAPSSTTSTPKIGRKSCATSSKCR